MPTIYEYPRKVDRYTRAGARGKAIFCPHCQDRRVMYHFNWDALLCGPCNVPVAKKDWHLSPPPVKEAVEILKTLDSYLSGVDSNPAPTYDDQTMAHYKYLIRLRSSGATNMWGATPYITKKFKVDNEEAGKILVAWIQTFDLPEDEQPKDGR
jgi:hypothetical protein